MKIFLLLLVMLMFFTCHKKDQPAATGSGATIESIQKEEVKPRQPQDMNITTPIDERPDIDKESR
jgi:hypothetical protein